MKNFHIHHVLLQVIFDDWRSTSLRRDKDACVSIVENDAVFLEPESLLSIPQIYLQLRPFFQNKIEKVDGIVLLPSITLF